MELVVLLVEVGPVIIKIVLSEIIHQMEKEEFNKKMRKKHMNI